MKRNKGKKNEEKEIRGRERMDKGWRISGERGGGRWKKKMVGNREKRMGKRK